MTFAEKLARLTEGKNKQKLGEDAGLPATAISNYISKGNLPRVDTALALARVLEVPLDWLVDDARDWPPPQSSKPTAAQLSDRELMFEVARRYRREMVALVDGLDQVDQVDWAAVEKELARWKEDEPMPPRVKDVEALVLAMNFLPKQTIARYSLAQFSDANHAQMPGSERPVTDFDQLRLTERMVGLMQNRGFREATRRLLPMLPAINQAEFDRIQFRDGSRFEPPATTDTSAHEDPSPKPKRRR